MEVRRYRYHQSPNPPSDFNRQNQKPTQTTDIDEKNLSYARQNILASNLKSRIRPLLTDSNDPLIPLDALGLDR